MPRRINLPPKQTVPTTPDRPLWLLTKPEEERRRAKATILLTQAERDTIDQLARANGCTVTAVILGSLRATGVLP